MKNAPTIHTVEGYRNFLTSHVHTLKYYLQHPIEFMKIGVTEQLQIGQHHLQPLLMETNTQQNRQQQQIVATVTIEEVDENTEDEDTTYNSYEQELAATDTNLPTVPKADSTHSNDGNDSYEGPDKDLREPKLTLQQWKVCYITELLKSALFIWNKHESAFLPGGKYSQLEDERITTTNRFGETLFSYVKRTLTHGNTNERDLLMEPLLLLISGQNKM